MSTDNNEQLDDKQISSIYSQTSRDLPSKQLDDAIVSAAKRAAAPHSVGPFSSNWRIPASLAAVLVISVGLVTFIKDDPEIAEDVIPFSIKSELISSTSQFTDSVEHEKDLKRSTAPAEQAIASLSAESPAVSNPKKMKQTISNDVMAKQRLRRQTEKQFSLPSLAMIKALRTAGNIPAANQAADKFIKQYFGDKIDNIDSKQIKLSNAEWKELINELRKLDREELADTLEKYLIQNLNR